VYERGEEETRWPVPLPGMRAAPYIEEEWKGKPEELVTEPLELETIGYPSVDVYRAPSGDVIQKVILRTRYMRWIELDEIEQIIQDWYDLCRIMSLGPYTLKDLEELGHPYGWGERGSKPSWARLRFPRAIPAMGAAAHIRGLRGRVPDRSIVNIQSGAFYESWYTQLLPWYGGVTILIGNRTFYGWFLAHGTIYMQAHGPWETVARRLLPRMHTAWRRAAYRAWRKKRAAEAQFGEGMMESQQAIYDAGGFK